jgi:hypothetical protein
MWKPAHLLALSLLAATAAFYVLVLTPAERELQMLERAVAERQTAASPPATSATGGAAAQLADFYSFFDRKLTYAEWLARFYAVADERHIEVHRAEYKRLVRSDAPMILYEVSLPVTGDYSRIRAFAEGVLSAVPVISLDHITFRRVRTGSDEVDAELKFTFYLPAGKPQE